MACRGTALLFNLLYYVKIVSLSPLTAWLEQIQHNLQANFLSAVYTRTGHLHMPSFIAHIFTSGRFLPNVVVKLLTH
jgi:hypothetical protein